MKRTSCVRWGTAWFVAVQVQAATYYVDVNYDLSNGAPDGSATRPYTNIGAGVTAANAADNNVVMVADGLYRSVLAGGYENFGTNGLTITKTITIRGGYIGQVSGATFDWTEANRVPTASIIDLTGAGTRAFVLNTGSKQPTIDGFTIRNGNVIGSGGAIVYGGGFGVGGRILNCVFSNNTATGQGGAVYINGNNNNNIAEITNCLFFANQAAEGGAVHVNNYSKTYDFNDCVFLSNVATGGGGGAVSVQSSAYFTRCRFEGNSATAPAGAGGATYNQANAAWVVARRCVFKNNTAGATGTGAGGAHGPSGGFSPGSFTAENCLFVGNAGDYTIRLAGNQTGAIILRHCTMADNVGGGVLSSHGLIVSNSIIANNGHTGIRTTFASPGINYNVVYGHATNYSGTASAGPNDLSVDPGFVGGGDYRLAKTSPAMDTAANLGATDDLDGVPRPTRSGFERGCYEEWQIPIITNRAPIVEATQAEVRAEFVYESTGIVTWAYFVLDTEDRGTAGMDDWWQVAAVGIPTQGVIFGAIFTGLSSETEYTYRCVASNSHDVFFGPPATFCTPSVGGTTRLWTGAGGNDLASNPTNWAGGVRPSASDYIVLDTVSSNMTWDGGMAGLPTTVARWTQTENYRGTVTVMTTYASYSTVFTQFVIAGDCIINGGVWTHGTHQGVQSTDAQRRYRLCVRVNGNFQLGSSARLDAFGRGLGNNGISELIRGTLGGQRAEESGTILPVPNRSTYGSITAPEQLGRGGDWGGSNIRMGGGAIWVEVSGESRLDGQLLANPGTAQQADVTPHHGSGGSIYVRTGRLRGSGLLDASNGDATAFGGGGRVALVVTGQTDFAAVTLRAYGGGAGPGAAGTVYQEHAGHAPGRGVLIIDNNNQLFGYYPQPYHTYGVTLMPDAANGGPVDLGQFAEIIVTNRAILGIHNDTILDWTNVNFRFHNRDRSFVTIRGASAVTWPSNFTVDGFTLLVDTNLVVTGNWTVASGGRISGCFTRLSFSGAGNTNIGYPRVPALTLTLAGNLTVQSGGEITVQRMGYYTQCGPGRTTGNRASSHGGEGGSSDGTGSNLTYGSVLYPNTVGSGGAWANQNFSPGGGRMRLTVTGALQLDGTLDARPDLSYQEKAAGGSIWLTAGTITGTGQVLACGRDGNPGGGGGRIAVYLTQGESIGSVLLDARGGIHTTSPGAAGTIYLEPASKSGGRGRLIIWNSGRDSSARAVTPLPPTGGDLASDLPPVYGAFTDNLSRVTLDIQAGGRVRLSTHTNVADLVIATNGYLHTQGYKLYVSAAEHHLNDPSKRGMGPTYMVDDYSNIIWLGRGAGTLIIVR